MNAGGYINYVCISGNVSSEVVESAENQTKRGREGGMVMLAPRLWHSGSTERMSE